MKMVAALPGRRFLQRTWGSSSLASLRRCKVKGKHCAAERERPGSFQAQTRDPATAGRFPQGRRCVTGVRRVTASPRRRRPRETSSEGGVSILLSLMDVFHLQSGLLTKWKRVPYGHPIVSDRRMKFYF